MRLNYNKLAVWVIGVTVAVMLGHRALTPAAPPPAPVIVSAPASAPAPAPPPPVAAPVVAEVPSPPPRITQNAPKAKAKKDKVRKPPRYKKAGRCAHVPAIAYKHPKSAVIAYATARGVADDDLATLKRCIGAD